MEKQEMLFPNFPRPQPLEIPSEGYLDDGEPYKLHITDEGLKAEFVNDTVPFEGHLHPIIIQFETFNLLQVGRVMPGGKARLLIRGVPAYGFRFADPINALLRLTNVLQFFQTWGVEVQWDGMTFHKNIVNRPVWWREQAALVKLYDGASGLVQLVPDPDVREKFKPEPWERITVEREGYEVWADIMDKRLNWFRGEDW